MERTDIFLSGGGPAGLIAAAFFGSLGFSVTLADPAPAGGSRPEGDLRTTAFLQPARAVLERAGLWEALAPQATDLSVMRIVDAEGTQSRLRRDFAPGDVGAEVFGWNLPNAAIRAAARARLGELPGVTLREGTGFAGLLARESEARITLSDGARLSARLAIAADGRDSPLRQAAGIGARTFRYGQQAVVFAVRHDEPHWGVSTEVHRSGGPFTLVPLPDDDEGRHRSSVVWMMPGREVSPLMALEAEAFSAAATERSAGALGPLTLVSQRQAWPIVARLADRMSGERVALVAEAAHVVPPIGAQGLNMSLADIAALADLAQARPEDLGDRSMLDAYHRRRYPDVSARVLGIDLLNRTSIAGAPMLRDARAAGIRALHGITPLRRLAMRAGLGRTPQGR